MRVDLIYKKKNASKYTAVKHVANLSFHTPLNEKSISGGSIYDVGGQL